MMLGLSASVFFAVTFVLNQAMSLQGGDWLWTASLRYIFMVPLLFLALAMSRQKLRPIVREIRRAPLSWMGWSMVGFGLFYAPLTFASQYSPGFVVAAVWQTTIIAGALLTPLLSSRSGPEEKRKRPRRAIWTSLVILVGIGLIEGARASSLDLRTLLWGVLPVLIAACAYPIGNRQMMEVVSGRLDALSRVTGMTIASLPLWVVLAGVGYARTGLPSRHESVDTFVVALSSGVIATVLFFKATDLARGQNQRLAGVEATQAGEVVFALVGQWILWPHTGVAWPSLLGLAVVASGIVWHSIQSRKPLEDAVPVSIHQASRNGSG